jgi:protein-disulfide isomerase
VGPPLKQLIKDPALKGRIKVLFKQFPLGFHKAAKPAAVASLAAHQQGKFWEYHDKIFANQPKLKTATAETYEGWAKELGLNLGKFKAYIASGKGAKIIEEDMQDGRKAGVRGTPSVYINGRKYQSTAGFSPQAFKSVINKYFKK